MSNDPASEVPNFQSAINQLIEFLNSQGFSSEPLWIFREDVAWRNDAIFVKVPLRTKDGKTVESIYNIGVERNLGLRLEVLCLLNSHPCCYVWLPSDEIAAEENGLLMSRFIVSIPNPLKVAESTGSALIFKWYKLLEGKIYQCGQINRVPSHRTP